MLAPTFSLVPHGPPTFSILESPLSMTKKMVVSCHRSKKIAFLWYNFLFEQIKCVTYESPQIVPPNCSWSVGCQIVSGLTFFTGASEKLKRGDVKHCAFALSVKGPRGHDFARGLTFTGPGYTQGQVQNFLVGDDQNTLYHCFFL